MIDINNEKYLLKLRKAIASQEGQLIIAYLKEEMKKFDFENIPVKNRENAEIGMDFKSFIEINKYFKGILSFFDELPDNNN